MMEKLLGTSPWPTIFGYAAGLLLDARVLIETGGTPKTVGDWTTLGLGVLIAALGRSAKQANVTNSKAPLSDAKTVQEILPP